jgi:hypothetical protein
MPWLSGLVKWRQAEPFGEGAAFVFCPVEGSSLPAHGLPEAAFWAPVRHGVGTKTETRRIFGAESKGWVYPCEGAREISIVGWVGLKGPSVHGHSHS